MRGSGRNMGGVGKGKGREEGKKNDVKAVLR